MKIVWVNGDKSLIAGSGYGECVRFQEVNSRVKYNVLFDVANVHTITGCHGETEIKSAVLVPSHFLVGVEAAILLGLLFFCVCMFFVKIGKEA